MIGMLAGLVGRLSGPVLVYVLLGLVATNALSGYLLKRAWNKNATAVLQCENQALRDANAKNAKVNRELRESRQREEAEKLLRKMQTKEADKKIQAMILAKDVEHEQQLATLEVATSEITDDEFFCASEPVSGGQLVGMRDAVATYNRHRNNPRHETGPP